MLALVVPFLLFEVSTTSAGCFLLFIGRFRSCSLSCEAVCALPYASGKLHGFVRRYLLRKSCPFVGPLFLACVDNVSLFGQEVVFRLGHGH